MKKNILKYIFLSVVFCAYSCNKSDNEIPYAYVDFEVDIYDPEYSVLANPGNSLIISEANGHVGYFGLNGVILYNAGNGEFNAYEATCTKDLNPLVIRSFFLAEDTVCGSQFSLPSEGTVMKGPAEIPLKPYSTFFNTYTKTISVYN